MIDAETGDSVNVALTLRGGVDVRSSPYANHSACAAAHVGPLGRMDPRRCGNDGGGSTGSP